ncbi:MAG: hypothetical protein ACLPSL_11280 [Smithella sp.]
MEFLTEHNVIAFLITFLLVLILVIQIQMGMIGKQIEEIKESMSVKIEELLKKNIKEALRNK